jgi:hypothetical protein
MARRLIAVPGALLLLALAAASIVGARTALDPQHLPALPAQGLAVQRAHDVLLVGLDGKAIGALPGYQGPYTGKNIVLEALAQADPSAVLLTDAAHRAYLLDPASSRLRRLLQMRLPLAGGATLSAHAVLQPSPYAPKIMLEVVQKGRRIGTRSQFLRVVGGRLVVSGATVTDTVTGVRWRVGSTEGSMSGGCEPAGISGRNLVAVCASGKNPAPLKVRATLISPSGARRGVGPTMRWLFGAQAATLSPDGRHVGITLAVGCGFPVAAVAPLGGGRAGYAANGKPVGSKASVASEALGWTADGQLVSHLVFPPTDCEHAPPSGIYAVDPATFARKLIVPLARNQGAAWLWGAA